jgi:hypothetical protein
MATKPTPAPLSGAYALIEAYGSIAVPIEVVQHLTGIKRIDSKYEDGKRQYFLAKDQMTDFKLFGSEDMRAMVVAHKLENP